MFPNIANYLANWNYIFTSYHCGCTNIAKPITATSIALSASFCILHPILSNTRQVWSGIAVLEFAPGLRNVLQLPPSAKLTTVPRLLLHYGGASLPSSLGRGMFPLPSAPTAWPSNNASAEKPWGFALSLPLAFAIHTPRMDISSVEGIEPLLWGLVLLPPVGTTLLKLAPTRLFAAPFQRFVMHCDCSFTDFTLFDILSLHLLWSKSLWIKFFWFLFGDFRLSWSDKSFLT